MPEVTLIYNPHAGLLDLVTPDQLIDALRQAGYEAVYEPTERERDLDQALADLGDVVVAAGGDGTVRAIATRLLDRDVALAIVPMETANNIAHTLGIARQPLEAVAGLANPRRFRYDVGHVKAPWGEDYFLETFGVGFFAEVALHYGSDGERTLPQAVAAIGESLMTYQSYSLRISLDGRDLSGDYAALEVFNIPVLGPRLELVPKADPGDGQLEVLCIGPEDRMQFLRAITGRLVNGVDEPPAMEVLSGRRLTLAYRGVAAHVDAKARPPVAGSPSQELPDEVDIELTVSLIPGAVQFLLPQPERSVQ